MSTALLNTEQDIVVQKPPELLSEEINTFSPLTNAEVDAFLRILIDIIMRLLSDEEYLSHSKSTAYPQWGCQRDWFSRGMV